jgi:hypothetical protein
MDHPRSPSPDDPGLTGARRTPIPRKATSAVATIGIDLGKNTFHLIGLDKRGAIMLRQKLSRGQVEARLANLPTRV